MRPASDFKNFYLHWHWLCFLREKVMNRSNPFQVPSCFQTNWEQRRRERFKKGVIATIVAGALLLIGLLIQGCKSERSAGAAEVTPLAGDVPQATPQMVAATVPASQPDINTRPVIVAPVSQPVVSKANVATAPKVVPQAAPVYQVKAGDTLTRIAKTHGTTVKAIEELNGLRSDRINVGEKLKIPEV